MTDCSCDFISFQNHNEESYAPEHSTQWRAVLKQHTVSQNEVFRNNPWHLIRALRFHVLALKSHFQAWVHFLNFPSLIYSVML